MEQPVYKLEGIVHEHANTDAMTDFEGPLDLILYLLGKNKIEIQDISISLILDQYLAYLEQRKQMDLELASEFVTMAAHLMYIKTRMLLSIEDEEAQNEMDALIKSLEERQNKDTYLRIKLLVPKLEPRAEFGRNIMLRPPEPMKHGKVYEYDHEKADLLLAFAAVNDRGDRMVPPQTEAFQDIVKREPYSVSDKAGEILQRLKTGGITRFLLLFRGSRSRSEIVATFIAVLELCKARVIRLAGGENDCTVDRAEDAPDEFVIG